MVNVHAGQLPVSPGMVRGLVNDQFPGWRHLAVTALASPGMVNAIYRIGNQLAARFRLRPGDAAAARRQLES
jgi:aminoglycoside phosphotransferase (APT) family kinase protein